MSGKVEMEIAQLERGRAARVSSRPGHHRACARPLHSRRLLAARSDKFFDFGRRRVPRVVNQARDDCAKSCRRDSFRHRARLHSRRSRRFEDLDRARKRSQCREQGKLRLEGKEYISARRRCDSLQVQCTKMTVHDNLRVILFDIDGTLISAVRRPEYRGRIRGMLDRCVRHVRANRRG